VKLPLLLSVPHAGRRVPPEVSRLCLLSDREIEEDGDVGAAEIYDLQAEVPAYVTTDIARAVVDMNRSVEDRRADGVVKTHTCWNVPVYREPLSEHTVRELLDRYYHPYHSRLRELAGSELRLAVDCHTMAAVGPPVGPDPGRERPRVCLSNGDGTCPEAWIAALRDCFEDAFGRAVKINDPFKGGHITRSHAKEMYWVQLEISRAPFETNDEKRSSVLAALRSWCRSDF
jgi:formiminoglutamase